MSEGLIRSPSGQVAGSADRRARRRQDGRDIIIFELAMERFALPLDSIQEIMRYQSVTEVPRVPPYILGIMSVRGRITTVIDLRLKLKMSLPPRDRHHRILLLDTGVEVVGLVVDRVDRVHRLLDEELELATSVTGDLSDHVIGIGRPKRGVTGVDSDEDDIIILLDSRTLVEG